MTTYLPIIIVAVCLGFPLLSLAFVTFECWRYNRELEKELNHFEEGGDK